MSVRQTTRLLVSPAVARLVKEGTPDEQLEALQTTALLPFKDRLSLALCLFQKQAAGMQAQVLRVLRTLATADLVTLLADSDLHPRHLELLARARLDDAAVMGVLIEHPQIAVGTLLNIARHCQRELFMLLVNRPRLLAENPELVEGLLANGRVDAELKLQCGILAAGEVADDDLSNQEEVPFDPADAPEDDDEDLANLSKYQMSLELPVAEKIKLALTGDKEWRSIFIRDANKLVSSAVLKNPRITDGEVLAVAKNKSSSDELIRLICMNNDWLKSYEIKRALVVHNRTPLPKALRFMGILSEKDIKALAKSRDVSSVIVNNARRMLMAKEQKK